jgi:ACS family glucarate transporter-like MFS transporter
MSGRPVVAGLFVLSLITYVDRAAISSAQDAMAADLALSDQGVGMVFSAFALGYALAQIPAGALADRIGPRAMLAAAVTAWSLLTALTGWAAGLWQLLAARFLFGAAEAGAFPGSARAFYNWLPSSEHGRGHGMIFAAARLGAAGAFPLMAALLGAAGWRAAFFWLAVPGLLWAAGWALLFRDHPRNPPPRQAAEEAGRPLAALLGSPALWLAMVQYFAANFTTFLCLSWMLPYLKDRYGLSPADAALYSMIPLLVAASSQWATGAFVDRLYRSGWRRWSRRLPAVAGFAVSAAGIVLIPAAGDVRAAVALFTVAVFGVEMTISPSWAFCLDLGGERSGAVTGAMNMAGNIGSFVSANAFPFLRQMTGAADAYFCLVGFLNLAGAACWLAMIRFPAWQHPAGRN